MVSFKLTEEERELLEAYAKEEGKSLSEYCRDQAFSYRGENVPMLELPDGTKVKVSELGKARFILELP